DNQPRPYPATTELPPTSSELAQELPHGYGGANRERGEGRRVPVVLEQARGDESQSEEQERKGNGATTALVAARAVVRFPAELEKYRRGCDKRRGGGEALNGREH